MTVLETDGLTKRFGELVAVDRMDVSVDEGEIHAVIGPNGAGKSTLFNCISGLLEPDDGEVYFQGEDVTGFSPHRIARLGIGRSFQIVDVFEGLTVRENVRIATQFHDDSHGSPWRRAESLTKPLEDAKGIIDDVGLTDQAETRADALSHGDRRKLDIGLTMAVDPEVVLLDEPTAGMGNEESRETIRMIRDVSETRNLTLVLIEHDVEIVLEVSDIITVMHEGARLATGSPEAIADNRDVQQAYLGTS